MTKQNNRLLSQDKSNHSTGALAATLFPAQRRNGTAVHQPKDVTEGLFSSTKLPTLALYKKKILRHIKLTVHAWSTKC